MIKERIVCLGVTTEDWTETHEETLNTFIQDPSIRLMIAFKHARRGFRLEYRAPSFQVDQMSYFMKNSGVTDLKPESFLKSVQYGTLRGAYIESLLRNMLNVYAPVFFENTSWPDSILCLCIIIFHKSRYGKIICIVLTKDGNQGWGAQSQNLVPPYLVGTSHGI